MPVQIKFIEDGLGVEFISSGIVTGNEIIQANEKIYTHEILPRLKYKIVDRTHCAEYNVTTTDIQIIAGQDRKAAKINPNIIIALVSTTPLQYGMSRMWETYVDETGFQMGIFKDRGSANTWLRDKLITSSHDADQ
jgi:hypothetical protein